MMNAPAAGNTPKIPIGSLVGGRFKVVERISDDAIGTVLRADDTKTGKAIALRILKGGLLDAEAMKLLRKEARSAATLGHRNIAATYGVGNDQGGSPFVAAEWVGGHPLTEAIAKRQAEGSHMSLKGAYNVIAHVCRALTAAEAKTCHGALHPGVVIITDAGRVKVAEFALGKTLVSAKGAGAFDEHAQASLAPEVKAGEAPTLRSDIFGVGAILYQLLTGRSPADGFVPPSQAHPDASEAIDEVLLKCLAMDPASRYGSPDEVRSALQNLVSSAPASDAGDVGLDVEVEVDVDLDIDEPDENDDTEELSPEDLKSIRPPANVTMKLEAVDLALGAKPLVGQRVSMAEGFRAPAENAALDLGRASAEVDLGAMLAKITENDAPRWMVAKDGLDHGPFSGRELVDLIVKGDIRAEHTLNNMDTGERKPLRQWPDFADFVAQQKLREQEAQRKQALASAEQGEKRTGRAKLFVAAGLLAAVAVGGVIFATSLQSGGDDEVASADLGELYESGEIAIEGTAGILPDPPRRGRSGMRSGAMGGGRPGGFAGSYEDAMNVAIDLGDANGMGSQRRLSPSDVQGTMNRHLNRIYNACVPAEQSRGGRLGNVSIDIAIAGSGAVMGVSARQGSSQFKSCIRNAVRRVRFPSFPAARMGARYGFAVD